MLSHYRQYIVLVLVVILVYGLAFWSPARGFVHKVSSPLFDGVGRIIFNVKSPFRTLMKISSLARENQRLETENTRLKAEVAKVEAIGHENELLRQELDFKNHSSGRQMVLAKIVGSSSEIYLNTLILSNGGDDGLKEGQAVVAQGFLVGRIESVEQKTAVVQPILAHNILIPAVLTKSGGTGLLRGGLEGLVLEDVPLDVPVEVGETVMTRDVEGIFPGNIPIGTVGQVQNQKGDIFQDILVQSPLIFNRLQWVTIIL